MGIDLNHPDELDWMARGRRGELREALFTNRASEQQVERKTENELLKRLSLRLVERGVVDGPAHDDPRDVDRVVTCAERMVNEVGPDTGKPSSATYGPNSMRIRTSRSLQLGSSGASRIVSSMSASNGQ